MKKLSFCLLLSVFYCIEVCVAQYHCCNEQTGECINVSSKEECKKTGDSWIPGNGNCVNGMCGVCCTTKGCQKGLTIQECEQNYSDGTVYVLRDNVNCDACQAYRGFCCVYVNGALDSLDSKVTGIQACGGIAGANSAKRVSWHKDQASISVCPATHGGGSHTNASRLNTFLKFSKAEYTEKDKSVDLAWRMAGADDAKAFYIERSRDGESYKKIGYIESNGNASASTFTDINPFTVGYYRLFIVHKDGSWSQSNPISVVGVSAGKMYLSPNPANSSIKILLNNMQSLETEVTVSDASGNVVIRKALEKGQFNLNISSLKPGVYYVRARQGDKEFISKMLKN